jgi:hypothetical protein
MKPTTDIASLQERQRQSLIQAIKDAEAAEIERKKLIRKASSADRLHSLNLRQERERARDHMKIECLLADFNQITSNAVANDMREVLSGRGAHPKRVIETMNLDRFALDYLHWNQKASHEKVEVTRRLAEAKLRPRYNEYHEINKVRGRIVYIITGVDSSWCT